MNQKFIKFIFLIFIFKSVYSLDKDELFGDKSIIRKLRNELGSFKTESKLIERTGEEYSVKEQYSFKSKNGEIKHTIIGSNLWSWSNDFELFYNTDFKKCSTTMNDDLMKSLLRYWMPDSIMQIPSKFKILGPSSVLFFLIDNYDKDKESVKCENIENNKMIRCDIIFDDRARLEYYFKSKDNMEMYPIKIKPFFKYSDKLVPYLETEYTKFDYSFNGDDYNVDFKIPIGVGCEKRDKNDKYPREETKLGEQLKIEYDAELEYLDLKTNDKDVYLKTQFKLQKLFIDTNFSFSILDRIDEETNKNIRTYLDTDTKLAYDVYDDKCIKHNLKDGFKQNWINTLYNIKYLHEYFFADSKYGISYLDTSKLENKIYRVFEMKQSNFFKPKKDKNDYRKPWSSIVTHYFSETDKTIPSLIEIRIRDIHGNLLGFLKIKINKYNFASSSDTFNEKIDLDQCFKNLKPTTDYKELNVKFYGNLKSFNDDYIKYEFRKSIDRDPTRDPMFKKNLYYSPLRIHDIKLERKSNQININAKLLEPIDNLDYFTKSKDVTFDESKERSDGIYKIDVTKIENIDNEGSCSRLCLQNSKCSAYSFKKQDKICKLRLVWLIYTGDIDNEYGYDWNELKSKSETGCVIGRRMIKHYSREHSPTKYTLDLVDKLIKKKEFNLILKKSINDKEIKFNQFKKSNPNKSNSIPYLLYSILAVLVISGITFGIIKYQKRNSKNNLNKLELM